jgi:hypothetical protein
VLIRLMFTRARKAVSALARAERHRLRGYATTLTVAVVAAGWFAAGQVGDGAVVALDEEDALFSATHLQKGEYANETHFLTGQDLLKHVQVTAVQKPVKAFAVMSDGLVRLALRLPTGDPHPPFFKPLFAFAQKLNGNDPTAPAHLSSFLSSDRVNARTDDDKTLILAAIANALTNQDELAQTPEVEHGESRS